MADTITVDGAVTTPLTLDAAALASGFAPVSVTLVNGDTYVGASVYSLLTGAKFLYPTDPTVKNGFLRDYVTATAANGDQVLLSEGEVDPAFGGAASTDIIAYQRNGAAIAPQLIVPGDLSGGIGGRDILVASLSVGVATVPPALAGKPSAPPLNISGDAGSPANPYSAASLQQIGVARQTDGFTAGSSKTTATFTGAPLQSVLNAAGVGSLGPADEYVVATGSDGYGVVYSRGEIDPAIRSAPTALVAYNDDSGASPTVGGVSGALRTTAPGDGKGGRYVSNLDSVTVARPQEAAVSRLYEGSLGRAPDTAGSAFWSGALEGEMTLANVAQSFIASDEFRLDGGAALDNTGYVNRLYQGDLGRTADGGGLAFWKGLLDSGTSRAEILVGFSSTSEAVLHSAAASATPA